MLKIYLVFIFLLTIISSTTNAFPLTEKKVIFDIIRKKKVIGKHEIEFLKEDDILKVITNINIDVKILFFPAYKFSHNSVELWHNNNFIGIDAYTDFEDEREYFIKGEERQGSFIASGMDGNLELDIDILPSNFWNIEILKEKEIFDTQKGIVRKIKVKDNGFEKIELDNKKVECKKFTLNASSNPKDKGPFPEYTLWYDKNDELMKFKFKNWKDDKTITIIRTQ